MGKFDHIEPGEEGNHKSYRICGANKTKGRGLCHAAAGWGTEHPGMGRCKLHGGNAPIGPAVKTWRSGIWGDVFKGTLKRAAIQVTNTADNEQLTDLSGELVAVRLLALMAWDKMQGGDGLLSSIREEDTEIIDAMLESAGGGGVAVSGGSKVSSSLVLPGEKTFLKKEEKPPEYDEMMVVLTHIMGVVKVAKEIEGIRNNDVPTRQELSYFTGVVQEVMNEFIVDAAMRVAFDNRLMERLGVRSASGT